MIASRFALDIKTRAGHTQDVAKDFISLPRHTGAGKLSAAKRAVYYYRPKGGIAVEHEADVAQLARTFANHSGMKMRVRISDSQHFVVVVDTKRLQYGYEIFF